MNLDKLEVYCRMVAPEGWQHEEALGRHSTPLFRRHGIKSHKSA